MAGDETACEGRRHPVLRRPRHVRSGNLLLLHQKLEENKNNNNTVRELCFVLLVLSLSRFGSKCCSVGVYGPGWKRLERAAGAVVAATSLVPADASRDNFRTSIPEKYTMSYSI